MVTVKQLKLIEKRIYLYEKYLSSALNQLSSAASEIMGRELHADICNGGEIEIREIDAHGFIDDFSCIRMEELINKLSQ